MSIESLLLTEGYLIYLILFSALMGGALGLPIPEDVPLISAGLFAARESANPLGLFLVCYAGVVIGDIIIFSMGRGFGATLFSKRWFRRRLSPRKLKRFKINLEKRSLLTIFVARHLFYLRMITFLTCGAVRMRYSRFIFADCLAALISVPLMMTLGYIAAEHYDTLHNHLEWIFGFIGVALLLYLLYAVRKGNKSVQASE